MAKATGGRVERTMVLQSPNESGRNEIWREERKRGVSSIETQIWAHSAEQYTVFNRKT